MFDRRHFIAGTAAASLLPSVGFAKGALAVEKADVVIIGAGLSGLNSALMLTDLGYKVVVLEAGSQVGGRVKTLDTSEGKLDVGASQIGRGYARVLDAVVKFGFQRTAICCPLAFITRTHGSTPRHGPTIP
jgi:monoamine oxidase